MRNHRANIQENDSTYPEVSPGTTARVHTCMDTLKSGAMLHYQRGFRHTLRRGYSCPYHRHPTVEMVYHPTGCGTTTLQDPAQTCIPYEPGTVVVYPRDCLHSQITDEDGTDCCIHFLCEPPMVPFFEEFTVFRNVHDSCLVQELSSLSAPPALPETHVQTLFDLRLTTLLAGLWSSPEMRESIDEDSTTLPPSDRYVRAAKRIISRNLTDPVSLEEVAVQIGIHADYLRHLFVQHEGQTLSQWLRDLRLRRACELLAFSHLPHKAIAVECGFQNDRYFCTVFRKQLGMTPSHYRASKQSAGYG